MRAARRRPVGYRVAFALLALLPLACWLLRARRARAAARPPPRRGAAKPRAWDLRARADVPAPAVRQLAAVLLLGRAHLRAADPRPRARPVSASVIGSILGAFAVAAAAIRVVLPLIASRLRERSVIAGANVVTALVFAAYPLHARRRSAWACARCVLGVALGAVQPMVMSMLHQITPHARHGEALGAAGDDASTRRASRCRCCSARPAR